MNGNTLGYSVTVATPAVVQVTIKIKDVEWSLEDAKLLYHELESIFGKDGNFISPGPYWNSSHWTSNPYVPDITVTSGGGAIKSATSTSKK